MRSLDELIEYDDPRWPDVRRWMAEATNGVSVFPPVESTRADALLATQVTTRSPMGAIIYESGGMLVDHGWLRILGGGCNAFTRSLPQWNRDCGLMTENSPPPFLLVADDVAGGFFAVNGGSLGNDAGNLYYFAPDTLDWEPLDMGYTDFIHWAFSGDLQSFYADFRWTDWVSEIADMSPDRTISFYPFLWTEADNLDSRHRGSVPVLEAFSLQVDMARQLNGRPT
ncbi:DUF2625 domain-containing protein [Aporhodopirellula aestuarii]|uniref:DUF2625 domain-containing protein n=2 Tax=Aporhodopirellula aestuarii TaxID=2950107 RepID=A0ABT0UF27_9BACT|nr:DUF2625 domain-containing protein [Aporhodopirellula aestuarii]MCM2374801.1 DUF2625 domain-containing protein [Aporhodopirellula aestuarii]